MSQSNYFENKFLLKLCIVFLSVIATIYIYTPGLSGPYMHDDFTSIVNFHWININVFSIHDIINLFKAGHSGPLGRGIAYYSFALNNSFTGLDPFYFKLTNLIIHICNALLIYLVFSKLISLLPTNANLNYLPVLLMALWIIHPINLTSILYAVQRMTSLSTLFSLLSLLIYLQGRTYILNGSTSRIRGWLTFVPSLFFFACAIFTKENQLILPLILLSIECFLLKFNCKHASDKKRLQFIFIGCIVIPFCILCVYLLVNLDAIEERYATRAFTLQERAITETHILIHYIQNIIFPRLQELRLYGDSFPISHSIFEPAPLLSSLILLGLLLLIILLRKKHPLLSFFFSFFFINHLLESTIYPLELYYEHRNYLASLGVLGSIVYLALQQTKKIKSRYYIPVVFIAYFAILGNQTILRAYYWADSFTLKLHAHQTHPNSYGATVDLANEYLNLIVHKIQQGEDIEEIKPTIENLYQHLLIMDNPQSGVVIDALLYYGILKQPFPTWHFEQILRRIKEKPFHISTIMSLQNIQKCLRSTLCTLPLEKTQINRLFNTIEDTFSEKLPVDFYLIWGQYLLDTQQYEIAHSVYLRAKQKNPSNINVYIGLTIYSIENNQLQEASQYLEQCKTLLVGPSEQAFCEHLKGLIESIQ